MACCEGGRDHAPGCLDRWLARELERNRGPVPVEVSRRVIALLSGASERGAA